LSALTGRRGGVARGGFARVGAGFLRVWAPAVMLFVYAAAFSFAYVSLGVGAGALVLFGTVQASLIVAALISGERPNPLQWIGLLAAVSGLVYLVMPGLAAPPLLGSALMAAAGLAWAVYTLLGRAAGDPLPATARAFLGAVPLALVAAFLSIGRLQFTPRGALLAVLSGTVASGLGYVAWYAALPGLTNTRAAAVQLSVPVLAAAGGVLVLGETITPRLLVAATAILGGVALTFRARFKR
jgi:drug/metabolite transporter (DMT)-like permease